MTQPTAAQFAADAKNYGTTCGPLVAGCDRETDEDALAIFAGNDEVGRAFDTPQIRSSKNGGKVEPPGSSAAPDALEEADNNARMFAAAPAVRIERDALRSSLQEVLRMVEAAHRDLGRWTDDNPRVVKARAALAFGGAA
ncbi:MAG: hypothetical protein ACREJD_09550 [Phycisphaerales bacterium]